MEVAIGYAVFFFGVAVFVRRDVRRLRDERDSLRIQVQAERTRRVVMGDRLLVLLGRVSELEAALSPVAQWAKMGGPYPTVEKPNNGRNLFRKMRDAARMLDEG